MSSLNIIGAGQVGKPIARLLAEKVGIKINCVLNRSLQSAQSACDFIGQGTPITSYDDLTAADYHLIATPDHQIKSTAHQLSNTKILKANNVVIQFSGVVASSELIEVKSNGALIASIHPVKSFVTPQRSFDSFAGTPCALEGDINACALLKDWMEQIGAYCFEIEADKKLLYHSGLVFACNNLVVLMEVALQSLEACGIPRKQASTIIEPIMQNTLTQAFEKGTAQGLSGPIARGESKVVKDEIQALQDWQPHIANLYKSLGAIALKLSQKKGCATEENLASINKLLSEYSLESTCKY